MRLSFVIMFCSLLQVSASTYSQNTKLDIKLKDASIIDVFKTIKKQSEFTFVYNVDDIECLDKINCNFKNALVGEVLDHCLKGSNMTYTVRDKVIILVPGRIMKIEPEVPIELPQNKTITGNVTDEKGLPLPGVSILAKGTTIGITTDSEGNYSIEVPDETQVLIFSFIGMKTREIIIGEQLQINITMEEDKVGLDEVVVVGYGTIKRINLTGAVDQIDSEILSRTPVGGIGEALQGQMPNVIINIADGKPGRNAGINIRGMTSINGGSPLILIDGIPGGDFNTIPPQDIESISVLKDAAAAAIYGGKATFGVVLITTKKAKKGEFSVNYSGSYSLSTPIIVPDVYTGSDYMEIQEEFSTNINQTYFTPQQIDYANQVNIDPSLPHAKYENGQLYAGGEVHNYYDEWFSDYTPKYQQHIAISSGGEKLELYTSVDYSHTKGPLSLSPTQIDRYYSRTNLKYNLTENFSFFENLAFTVKDSDIPDTEIYSFRSNIFRFLDITWPMMPEYVDVDGEQVATNLGWWREYLGEKSFRYEKWRNMRNTAGFDWSLFQDLVKLHGDYTYETVNWNKERYRDNSGPFIDNTASNANNIVSAHSKFASEYYRSSYYTTRNVLNIYGSADHNFGKHYVKGLIGFNQEDYTYLKYYAKIEDPLNILPVRSLSLGTGEATASDGDDRYALRSAFFRMNYNYDERFLGEINGAYFLSSKFEKENRSSIQPSLSAGWVISNEEFFTKAKEVMSHLKLRASYGTLGNQNIGSYDYLEIMSVGTISYLLDGVTTSYVSGPDPKSSNFTWEKATTLDVGLDMNFLSNKITTSFDIYNRITSGMLVKSYSLPSVYGAPVPKENNASLETKGWEATLTYRNNFKLLSKTLNYNIRFALSDNSTTITDYENPTGYLGDYYEGMKIGEIWGLTTLGLFETDEEAAMWPTSTSFWGNVKGGGIRAGDLKFEDKNDDGMISKGNWTLDDHGDFEIIGNSMPRYLFGLTIGADWNGFDFNAFINGVGKRDFYPDSETNNFWSAYNRKYSTLLTHVVENSWTEDNPDAYFPRRRGYIAQGGYELDIAQTRYLQNAAYLRLKNLTLGYTLPEHITKRIRISKLRVFFNGQNLWELSSLKEHFLDPEGLSEDPDANSTYVGNGTAYSISRVYSFGIQANF